MDVSLSPSMPTGDADKMNEAVDKLPDVWVLLGPIASTYSALDVYNDPDEARRWAALDVQPHHYVPASRLVALQAERDALAEQVRVLTGERDEWKRKCGDANLWGLRNAAAWKRHAETAERELAGARALELQRGNALGRIAVALLGNQNNVSDDAVVAAAERVAGELAGAREKYDELIMAVASKWPGETRHETALRYINEREQPKDNAARAAQKPAEGGEK